MSAEEVHTAVGSLSNPQLESRLTGFLGLAPVLLRAQSRRVVSELVVTAVADLLPELTFTGLLLLDETTNNYSLVAHRNHRLLQRDESEQLLKQLVPLLAPSADQPQVTLNQEKLGETMCQLLTSSLLYVATNRTPTRRFGYLLGGANAELGPLSRQYFFSLAELTAIALDNAMRFDDLKEAAHEMSLVNEMAGSLAASLNGEELFNSFMSRLSDIILVERANLILLAPLSQTYSLPFCWNHNEDRSRRTYLKDLPIIGSPFEEAIRRQEIMVGQWHKPLTNNWPEDNLVFDAHYQSQMIIPLIAKKQVLGVLALGTQDSTSYRDERMRRSLLEKLAALFALALLNSRLYEEKQLSAEFDSRIGVYNHDYFDRELANQIHKARRNDYRLGLLMIDMDNLKTINDKYGHLAGDAALRHVAGQITRSVRATDVVARYGGDEFGVMLLGCTTLGLEVVAEKTRRAIQNTPLVLENQQEVPLSVSIGAVICPEDATTPRELIQQADDAMYVAKLSRNQVRIGSKARLPLVSEHELGMLEPSDAPASALQADSFSDLSTEDYDRFLVWLGDNRAGLENQVVHELNERLISVRQRLSENEDRTLRLETGLLHNLRLMAELVEYREPYLAGGTEKLVQLVEVMGAKLNLSATEASGVVLAAWLSNLGRLMLPETLWQQPGRLTAQNWQDIQQIPLKMTQKLEGMEKLLPPNTLTALLHQRERFDGAGYPLHLAGEEIPLAARLLGITSALVAMSQPRPFRPRRNRAACQRQLERGAGRQFDANLTGLLLKLLTDGELDFLDFGE